MYRLDLPSSDESDCRLFENSGNDSSGSSTSQDVSSHERNKLPRINVSPRRNHDSNYEISPPPSPPINNPRRKCKSRRPKPSSKPKPSSNGNPEDYKVRVIQKNEQGCLIIMENSNDRSKPTYKQPKPSNAQLPRISLTPMAENGHQSANTNFQATSSPRSNYQQCQILPPTHPNPNNSPTTKPRQQICRPKQTNPKKKRTTPEDFHARIIESYGNNEWVGIIGIQPETKSNRQNFPPSSSHENHYQSTTARTNYNQSNEYENYSSFQQSNRVPSDFDFNIHHHAPSYLGSLFMVTSSSNSESDKEDDDYIHNYASSPRRYSNESQSHIPKPPNNDNDDHRYSPISAQTPCIDGNDIIHSNRNSDDSDSSSISDSNNAHWDIDEIADKKGPWIEYHVTSKDVKNDAKCSICFDEFKEGQKASKLNCGHFFHEDCILVWYDKNRSDPTCPICRKNMNDPCSDDKKSSDNECMIC